MLKQCHELFRAFAKDEEGATAIEYGLIVGLIAIALIVALITIGGDLGSIWDKASEEISTGAGQATGS